MNTEKKGKNKYYSGNKIHDNENIKEQYIYELQNIKASEQLKRRIQLKAESTATDKVPLFCATSMFVTMLCIAVITVILMTGRRNNLVSEKQTIKWGEEIQIETKQFSDEYEYVGDIENNNLEMVYGRLFYDKETESFQIYKDGKFEFVEQKYRECEIIYGEKLRTLCYRWCNYDNEVFLREWTDSVSQPDESKEEWTDIRKNGTQYYVYFYTRVQQDESFRIKSVYPILFDAETGGYEDIFSNYKINGICIDEYFYHNVQVINDTFAQVSVSENFSDLENYIINMKKGTIEKNEDTGFVGCTDENLTGGRYDFVGKEMIEGNQNSSKLFLKCYDTNEYIPYNQKENYVNHFNSLCIDSEKRNLLAVYKNHLLVLNLDTMTSNDYETDYEPAYFEIKKAAWSENEIFLYIYREQYEDSIISVYKRSEEENNKKPDDLGIQVFEKKLSSDYTKIDELQYDETKYRYISENIFFCYDNQSFYAYENGNYESINTIYKEINLSYDGLNNTIRYYYCSYGDRWWFYQQFGDEFDERNMIMKSNTGNSSMIYLYLHLDKGTHEGPLKEYPLSFNMETGEYIDFLKTIRLDDVFIKDYDYLQDWTVNGNCVYVKAGRNETGQNTVREEDLHLKDYVINLMNGSSEAVAPVRSFNTNVYNQKDAEEEYKIIVQNGLLFLKNAGTLFQRVPGNDYVVCLNKDGRDKMNTFRAVAIFDGKVAILDLEQNTMKVYDVKLDTQKAKIESVSWSKEGRMMIELEDNRVLFYK